MKNIYALVNIKSSILQIHNHLKWKSHSDQIIPEFCRACYVVRFFEINNISLGTIYFASVRHVQKIAENNRFIMSVHSNNLDPIGRIFMKFDISLFFDNVEKIQVSINSDKNNG
jgi:hypothetical protein